MLAKGFRWGVGASQSLIWGLALVACWPILAQDADDDTAAPQDAVRVEEELFVAASLPYAPASNTIATKLPVPLAWTPANVGVVGQAAIREQNALVMGDALANVSGVNVQTGQGVFDFFVVRGFDSLNSSLVLTDGAPEPEVTFYQLYNVEQVEVLKGPGGFLYGASPLSGAVNLVRKQPVPEAFASVGVEGGSFGTYGATFDWNHGAAERSLDLRVGGLYRQSDGFRDGREWEVAAVNPSLTWRPSEKTRVNFNAELLRFDATPDSGVPLVGGLVPDVPRERSYGSAFDESRQDIQRLQVDVDHELGNGWHLRNKTYFRKLEWDSDGTILFGAFPNGFGGFAVARSLTQLEDEQNIFGNQLEAVLETATGSVSHRILTGLELTMADDTSTLRVLGLPFLDLGNPQEPPVPLELLPVLQLSRTDNSSRVAAPYVIDQITFTDRFQVLAGLRLDHIELDDDVAGLDRSDDKLSPMLGAVFQVSPSVSLYANGARSFAPPSARIVGLREVEESEQIEVGAKGQFLAGRLSTTLSLFDLERQNIAIPDDNGFTQQAGDQRSKGVELELSADWGGGWAALFSFAHTDSELTRFAEVQQLPFPPFVVVLDRSGNRSAFAPENLANLWLRKRFGSGLGLGLGARYVDEQFLAEDNLAAIGDYTLLNAALWYGFGDWRLAVNVENLGDEDYETRAFGSGSVIPGEPVNVSLRVDYRW